MDQIQPFVDWLLQIKGVAEVAVGGIPLGPLVWLLVTFFTWVGLTKTGDAKRIAASITALALAGISVAEKGFSSTDNIGSISQVVVQAIAAAIIAAMLYESPTLIKAVRDAIQANRKK